MPHPKTSTACGGGNRKHLLLRCVCPLAYELFHTKDVLPSPPNQRIKYCNAQVVGRFIAPKLGSETAAQPTSEKSTLV